ncbi:MAG: 1-deoxy-D-xylulose-5-phosphate reductoisomerase [Acinetobacter sp.]|nr:1-deoxy-D-xylulose-5-phosphate reductoisomerase [Acinetobacter sp.]
MRQSVCILGATGSIGQSTLKVLQQHPEQYHVYAVTAHSRMDLLLEICIAHRPQVVVIPSAQYASFKQKIAQSHAAQQLQHLEILTDEAGLMQVAAANEVDIVMAAIVGAAGLLPTFAAVKAGKRVLLANKEALVMSGDIMMQAVKQYGATLLPVDSEHNAIFQSLPQHYTAQLADERSTPKQGVAKLILTASGGPFLHFTAEQLTNVTPAQACKHPNWSMGQKISVDSATLMNKGLELIEACHLFALDERYIDVVIHPESIIHSLVQYVDGSTLAQLGNPDMCTPIAHALAYPQRIGTHVAALDLVQLSQLNFIAPDVERFPALNLARAAIRAGGTLPTVFNAANEIAVAAFLQGQIAFTRIADVVDDVLQRSERQNADDLDSILAADTQARQLTQRLLQA